MKNTFGSALCLTIFGESHGAAIGADAGCAVSGGSSISWSSLTPTPYGRR